METPLLNPRVSKNAYDSILTVGLLLLLHKVCHQETSLNQIDLRCFKDGMLCIIQTKPVLRNHTNQFRDLCYAEVHRGKQLREIERNGETLTHLCNDF